MGELSGSPGKRSFLASPKIQETLYVFGIYVVQKTMETEQNVNESSGPSGKRSFLCIIEHSILETVYVFRLDAVQKTTKTEKNVNELSGSRTHPGSIVLSIMNTPRDTLWFWT